MFEARSLNGRFIALNLMAFLGIAAAAVFAGTPSTTEQPFLSENQSATQKMMAGMEVVPSGDVDSDFAAMMMGSSYQFRQLRRR